MSVHRLLEDSLIKYERLQRAETSCEAEDIISGIEQRVAELDAGDSETAIMTEDREPANRQPFAGR